jgi:Spy/CpxP family protein refolding chaperone
MKTTIALLLLLVSAAASAAEPAPAAAADDPLARSFFPPDLVMKHQKEIGLTERQRETIKTEIQKAQSKFLDLQFQVQSEAEELLELVQSRPVDEARALAQAEAVMRLETETKKLHLGMLVRIKNMLTETQVQRLAQLRDGAAP